MSRTKSINFPNSEGELSALFDKLQRSVVQKTCVYGALAIHGSASLVAKTVNGLYGRRSKIVHTGAYGVSRRESALLHFYCMSALGMLVVSPAFAGFSTSTELEDWFKDRMLDGPNHLEQESETAAVEIAPVS